jgi:hypothetical protein
MEYGGCSVRKRWWLRRSAVHWVLAPVLERLADDHLRLAAGVHIGGVDERLIPASSAEWIMRTDSPWSVVPMAPNIIVPSPYSLTDMPVPPRTLHFMTRLLVIDASSDSRAVNGLTAR